MLHIQQHMLHIHNPTGIVVELHSFADSTFKNTKSETMDSFYAPRIIFGSFIIAKLAIMNEPNIILGA